jgi:nitroreductase
LYFDPEVHVDLFEAIKTRRSIRRYKDDPVDDQTIEAVLEAGRWAPSWKNTQCWRFIVVRDAGIKAKLADTLISPVRDGVQGKNGAADAVKQAPAVIVACAELGKSGLNSGALATDKGDWFMFDVGLAMQNIVLAAQALGLGTVHVGLLDHKKAAEILGVPAGFCVVELTPLGYPDPSFEAKAPPRKTLNEIAFKDKWGQA